MTRRFPLAAAILFATLSHARAASAETIGVVMTAARMIDECGGVDIKSFAVTVEVTAHCFS